MIILIWNYYEKLLKFQFLFKKCIKFYWFNIYIILLELHIYIYIVLVIKYIYIIYTTIYTICIYIMADSSLEILI